MQGLVSLETPTVEIGELDASELIHFLIRWFLDHTTVQDIKFAKFLAACSNSS